MPSLNKIIVASAGSGKTSGLVYEACREIGMSSALITYTINGRDELERKTYALLGFVPPKVTIDTWYSFLLKHFIRPYQNHLYEPRVKAIDFNRIPLDVQKRFKKENVSKFYFSGAGRIWSDRAADFACRIIEATKGLPLKRLERIFSRLYFDEAQDFSGWDLELIDYLLRTSIQIHLVGDYRQATYSTNSNHKNKPYAGANIVKKFKEWNDDGIATLESLAISHRCNQLICSFADRFFPNAPPTKSLNEKETSHDGVFLLFESELDRYCHAFNPQHLRYNRTKTISYGMPLNFGEAKGMTFDRVVIHPHGPFQKFLRTGNMTLAGESLTRAYVAVTRARYSVAITVPNGFKSDLLPFFSFN